MTAPASTPVPHSRWLVRESADRLAASHAAAVEAISALHTAADPHRERSRTARQLRIPLVQRMAMRQDWPQVICFCLVLLAMALFLGWVSDRLIAHLAPLPAFVAALPGVLLAAATGGAARLAAHSVKRRAEADGTEVLPSVVPLAASSAGVAAWVSLWLTLTSGTPGWAAVIFALALTLGVAVALVTCAYLGGPPAGGILGQAADTSAPSRPSRRLLARRRRARRRLDDHTRQWMAAAHRYAVTLPGKGQPERILASLLADDADQLPLDGLDPFDAMILSALRNYHPAVLAADLNVGPD